MIVTDTDDVTREDGQPEDVVVTTVEQEAEVVMQERYATEMQAVTDEYTNSESTLAESGDMMTEGLSRSSDESDSEQECDA